MKRKYFILCLFALHLGMTSQSGFVASGGAGSGTGGAIHFSAGQTDYLGIKAVNGYMGQGIQQPYEIFTVTGLFTNDILLDYIPYPNPCSDYLNLRVNKKSDSMKYILLDLNGKIIAERPVDQTETQIPMYELPEGLYKLNIVSSNQLLKSFNIIKN